MDCFVPDPALPFHVNAAAPAAGSRLSRPAEVSTALVSKVTKFQMLMQSQATCWTNGLRMFWL